MTSIFCSPNQNYQNKIGLYSFSFFWEAEQQKLMFEVLKSYEWMQKRQGKNMNNYDSSLICVQH